MDTADETLEQGRRPRLMLPGPTEVPAQVLKALSRPTIGHRGGEFRAVYRRVRAALGPLFGTTGEVVILPAAGTGGLEAVVENLFVPGDRVLACVMGVFGERFAEVAHRAGLEVDLLEVPFGRAISPAALSERLARGRYRGVLLTHNETSTGVTMDLEAVAAVLREEGVLVCVDAVSSLGAIPVDMDRLGLDAVVSCSQKALMCPPGLALVALSGRALRVSKLNPRRPLYWDFLQYVRHGEGAGTPYTPAVNLWFALAVALDMIHAEGLERVYLRHRGLGAAFRAGIAELVPHYRLFAVEGPSDTVTAVEVIPPLTPQAVRKRALEDHGLAFAGGQKGLAGKLVRVGHMGYCSFREIELALCALADAAGLDPAGALRAAEEAWEGVMGR